LPRVPRSEIESINPQNPKFLLIWNEMSAVVSHPFRKEHGMDGARGAGFVGRINFTRNTNLAAGINPVRL
jgi:hypothetical protein